MNNKAGIKALVREVNSLVSDVGNYSGISKVEGGWHLTDQDGRKVRIYLHRSSKLSTIRLVKFVKAKAWLRNKPEMAQLIDVAHHALNSFVNFFPKRYESIEKDAYAFTQFMLVNFKGCFEEERKTLIEAYFLKRITRANIEEALDDVAGDGQTSKRGGPL